MVLLGFQQSVQQRKLLAELAQRKTVTLSEIQAIYHKTIFLTNSLPPKIDIQNEVLLSILKLNRFKT